MAALLLSELDCEASLLGRGVLPRGRGCGEPAVKVPELVPELLVLTWPDEEGEELLLESRPPLRMPWPQMGVRNMQWDMRLST